MLAVITTDALGLIPPLSLKSGTSPQLTLLSTLEERPTSLSWSPDGSGLFMACARSVFKYDPSGMVRSLIYTTAESSSIIHLISKDRGNTQILSSANKVFVLECGSGTGKISKTFDSHKSTITSISLSNDGILLASTSSDAAHVHNLTLASHTVLRGLPLTGSQKITTCAFHPHSRARLFLGIGKQMVIYDTTRPSAPLKLVLMPDRTSGEIVAIACSPFSKSLVAVATTGGDVGLVDLEKDKSPRRNFSVKAPITSLLFSPEGDTIYIGIESGKILVKSLRALENPPVSITVSDKGSRIQGISIQRKMKCTDQESVPKVNAVPSRKHGEQQDPSKQGPEANRKGRPPVTKVSASPPRDKLTTAAPVPAKSARIDSRAISGSSKRCAPDKVALESREPKDKQVFSPVRDPLGNSDSIVGDISVKIESLMGMKAAKPEATKTISGRKEDLTRTVARAANKKAAFLDKSNPESASRPASAASTGRAELPKREARARTDSTASTRSNADKQRIPNSSSATSVPSSSSGTLGSASCASRPLSSLSSRSSSGRGRTISGATSRRTPSPDLPSPENEPMTPPPLAQAKQKERMAKLKAMSVLGLGTPEVDAWMDAGKANAKERVESDGLGRRVGFLEDGDKVEEVAARNSESDDESEDAGEKSLVISPCRAPPSQSTWAPVPSPLRGVPSPGRGPGSSAQDLLRTIVQDVMYEYQRETKAEMMGLHLDLVRMGRTWRKEMRDVMQEYAGEMKELREENKRLREDNERLRRGF